MIWIKKQVWKIKSYKNLPNDIHQIPMKWVFKIKSDGWHRAILVAKGYKQISGIDYFSSHSPVITEITFRIILITSLWKQNVLRSLDIEKAFLEPVLNENLYAKIPEGLVEVKEVNKDDVCELNKSIYGIVQESKYFY